MSKLTALFRLTFIVLLAGAGLVLIPACDAEFGDAEFGDAELGADSAWNKGVAAYKRGDFATALRELQPLAEQGHADAQHALGRIYDQTLARYHYKELNVPQDYKTAVQWFRRAAEQGYAEAQASLSMMYFAGKGVLKDYVYAHMWANIAASGGAKHLIGIRKIIELEMTPFQIIKAQKLAQECVRKEYKNC